MWVIVKKTDYGELDYLPKSWLLDSGKEAKYPLVKPSEIKRFCDSNHDLQRVAFEIIKVSRYNNKEYDTWESAYDNCIRFAKGRRSKSSSEREVKGRGKRDRRKKRLTSSEDSASSEEDSLSEDNDTSGRTAKLQKLKAQLEKTEHRPVPPAPVRSTALSKEKNSRHSVIVESPSFMYVSPDSPSDLNTPRKIQEGNPKFLPNPSPKVDSVKKQLFNKKFPQDRPSDLGTPRKNRDNSIKPSPKVDSSNNQLKKKPSEPPAPSIAKKKNKCKLGKKTKHSCCFRLECNEMEAIMHTLCSIGADVQEMKFRLKNLKKSSGRQSEMEEIEQVEIPAELEQEFKFPISSQEVLDNFEEKIQSDKDTFKTLVKVFTWQHRNDSCVANTARGIAKVVMTESLLSTFSLQGGRAKNKFQKRAFNTLALYALIIQVVKRIWKVFDDPQKEANNTLGPFLTGCKAPVDE